jgi:TolB-like protein
MGWIAKQSAFPENSRGTGTEDGLLTPNQQVAPAAPEKSIAVLPFENLSDDKQNAYFATGVQDDARTDAHLWAETYDCDLADVFSIESEIAEQIADQLSAKLSPNGQSLGRRPTEPTTSYN